MERVKLSLDAQFDTIYAQAPDGAEWVVIEKADELGDVSVTYLGAREKVMPNGGPYKVNLIGEMVPRGERTDE